MWPSCWDQEKMSDLFFFFLLNDLKTAFMGAVGVERLVVPLTHQWGSLVSVTTMTSSLKKASCSEPTDWQSTKALTRVCGLLPETWRRREKEFSELHQQIDTDGEIFLETVFMLPGIKRFWPLHFCEIVEHRAWQVKQQEQDPDQNQEQYQEENRSRLSCSTAPPGCQRCLETENCTSPGCFLHCWSGGKTSSSLN